MLRVKMKIHFAISCILFLFNIISASSAIKSEILANPAQDVVRSVGCLVKFMHVPGLKSTLVFDERENTKEVAHEVLKKLIKVNKSPHTFNIAVNTCGPDIKCNSKGNVHYEQYFLFANSSKELNTTLRECLCSNWSPTARFIIISNQATDIGKILDLLKRSFIFKAVLVTSWNERFVTFKRAKPRWPQIASSQSSDSYDCFTNTSSLPLELDLHAIAKCKPKLGVRIAVPYTRLLTDNDIKVYRAHFKYAGIEIQTVGLITNTENMPLPVSDNNELGAYNDEDRTGHGLMNELVNGDVDLLVGALPYVENNTYIDSCYPLIYTNLVAVVKKRVEPNLLNLVKVLQWKVWVVVLIIVIIFVIITYILFRYNNRASISIVSIIFGYFSILIGQDAHLNQRYLRLILIAWVWITFMLRSSYEAYSTQLFINKDSLAQVDSLDEVCRNNYSIFVTHYNYALFNKGYQLAGCSIPAENFKVVNDTFKALVNSESNLVAAFIYKQLLTSYLGGYADVHGRVPFHVIKEDLSLVPLFYYFRRGDPFLEAFQKRGMNVLETGLLEMYRRVLGYLRDIQNHNMLRTLENRPELSMKQVAFIFYIYLFGISAAIVVFCIELIYYKYSRR